MNGDEIKSLKVGDYVFDPIGMQKYAVVNVDDRCVELSMQIDKEGIRYWRRLDATAQYLVGRS